VKNSVVKRSFRNSDLSSSSHLTPSVLYPKAVMSGDVDSDNDRTVRSRRNSWAMQNGIVYDETTSTLARVSRESTSTRDERSSRTHSQATRIREWSNNDTSNEMQTSQDPRATSGSSQRRWRPRWPSFGGRRMNWHYLRVANYFTMLYSAFATIAAGKAAERRENWELLFTL